MFFCVYVLFVLHLRYAQSWPVLTFISFIVLSEIWFVEFRDLISSNAQMTLLTTIEPTLNLLLTNTLNKYHPFIFYLSLALTLLIFLINMFYYSNDRFFWEPLALKNTLSLSKIALALNFTALFMGSWWALQEGTWGGWWNWDSSEVFGLLPGFIILSLFHKSNILKNFSDYLMTLKIGCTSVLIFYVLLQFNFELISHNFGPKFFFFFNSNLGNLVVCFTATILISSITVEVLNNQLTRFVLLSRLFWVYRYSEKPYIAFFTAYSIVLLWVVYALLPFFELTLFNIFNLNTSFTLTIYNLHLSLWIVFWLLFGARTYWVISGTSILVKDFSRDLLHNSILLSLFLNLFVTELTLNNWDCSGLDFLIVQGSVVAWFPFEVLTLDTWDVDEVGLEMTSSNVVSSSWTTKDLTNVTTLNHFTLSTTDSGFENRYNLGKSYQNILLNIEIPLFNSISLLYLTVMFSAARLYKL